MFFKQFVREGLGCASYIVGDTGIGECAVVDPSWEIAQYTDLAASKGLRIRYVIETHNHADHVSGHGKLAALGAEVCVHEEAGVEYPHRALKDGENITMGTVRLTILHTPGHRPEHISVAVADLTRTEEAWMVLTGDSLFVGDVARPDLAVQPAEGAALLYRSLQAKLLTLPDGVEVYPAHVSGSLCGKAMSEKASSTIGFERNFSAPLAERTERDFVRRVTSELPPQPPQFGRIVSKNRGPFLTQDPHAKALILDEVDTWRKTGALVLDTRTPEAFGAGHIPGSLNVDLYGGQFATRASWLLDPGVPVVLVLERPDDLVTALGELAAAGHDNVEGFLLDGMRSWDSSGRPLETVIQLPVMTLRQRLKAGDATFTVVDVRESSEWNEGHIEGAVHIPFHQLKSHLDSIPSNRTVATICGGGTRSSIAASILKAEGFDALNVTGGMDAWDSVYEKRPEVAARE